MKMTRLEWRYLKKIALDHPYFDTHPLPITEEEADAIVKANVTRTGKEFVDSIYAQLGMTRPERKKSFLTRMEDLKELFYVPPIRKLAIAMLVILLLTVFFAATPIGHAIAASAINYIISVFDGGIGIHSDKDRISNETISQQQMEQSLKSENLSLIKEYPSISRFTSETGYSPIRLSAELFTEEIVSYTVIAGSLYQINIIYSMADGTRIMTSEEWGSDYITIIAEDDNDHAVMETVLDEFTLAGYYDDSSQEFLGTILFSDHLFSITYQGSMDYHDIISAIVR